MNTRLSYKLPIQAKKDILSLVKTNMTNNQIVETIKERYNISVSSSSITQYRQRAYYSDLGEQSTAQDWEYRKASAIKKDLIMSIAKSYKLIERYINNKSDITDKQAVIINNIIGNLHRIYRDIYGNNSSYNNNTTTDNIRRVLGG